jgi:hypothetical protein
MAQGVPLACCCGPAAPHMPAGGVSQPYPRVAQPQPTPLTPAARAGRPVQQALPPRLERLPVRARRRDGGAARPEADAPVFLLPKQAGAGLTTAYEHRERTPRAGASAARTHVQPHTALPDRPA